MPGVGLSTGGAQRPRAHLINQTCFFQQRHKFLCPQQAALGMLPAEQGLGPANLVVGQLDDGLVVNKRNAAKVTL